ncbi:hypothetical protein MIND_01128700 [Mycena indigotica]|uniref:Uncharacterized protein n=1 Tax=Mycena indigotica TaxID=2126181 RepID=A0A8H6VVK2_9AGAR|nr:uncharacterized protein MIND_01128700 [Mycena indigotica]KAF7293506.1 hypothetical protein MIND_01128700 [Mycena indigotica]
MQPSNKSQVISKPRREVSSAKEDDIEQDELQSDIEDTTHLIMPSFHNATSLPVDTKYQRKGDSKPALFEDTHANTISGGPVDFYNIPAYTFDMCMYRLAAHAVQLESSSENQKKIKEGLERAVKRMDQMRTESSYRMLKTQRCDHDMRPTVTKLEGKMNLRPHEVSIAGQVEQHTEHPDGNSPIVILDSDDDCTEWELLYPE